MCLYRQKIAILVCFLKLISVKDFHLLSVCGGDKRADWLD